MSAIASLAEDRVVEGVYAVARKERRRTRGGSPYLALELRDKSGAIPARIFRDAFRGVLISAGGYTAAEAEKTIANGYADAIAFGRLFIANPDLPERIRSGAPLNRPDHASFYGGTEVGYTDYPALETADR